MEEKEKKPGFFKRLVSGLTKTRDNIVSGIDSLFSGFSHIDDDFYEELEEILIMGDLGVRATENIIEDLQRKVKEQHIKEPSQCKQLLIDSIKKQMYAWIQNESDAKQLITAIYLFVYTERERTDNNER